MTANTMNASPALFVKMGVDAWHAQNSRVEKLLNELPESRLEAETAPGRNTGKYLLGHLVAVSDRMLETLGWGPRLHPELDEPFLLNPDRSGIAMPSVAELKQHWKEVNDKLNAHIARAQPEEWFSRHLSVSEDDFAKEPHRNKLNLLINRAVHTGMHLGQMNYLTEKK